MRGWGGEGGKYSLFVANDSGTSIGLWWAADIYLCLQPTPKERVLASYCNRRHFETLTGFGRRQKQTKSKIRTILAFLIAKELCERLLLEKVGKVKIT